MMQPYYDDLSAPDSSEESSDEEQIIEIHQARQDDTSDNAASLWRRCIVHLDADCFYCQCEEIDGAPHYKHRPLAIGQKHIIVTSNYIARKEGVKKLQLRTDAMRACPSLLILEGSDLERYRQHSRRIYQAFREGISDLSRKYNMEGCHVPVRKGGMDELFADLTDLVNAIMTQSKAGSPSLPPHTFIYGDQPSSSNTPSNSVSITEDQSGAHATLSHNENERVSARESAHVNYGSLSDRRECEERLHVAAALCEQIRQHIRQQTGFTTTIGVSVSPMLAKLTSDMHKPNHLNIMYPWRSHSVILPMPLRKVPELGSRTLKALKPCLERCHPGRSPEFWTCRDLLHCSRYDIVRSLEQVQAYEKSSDDMSQTLLQKCRGVDSTQIIDDAGGLSKTVSVENSFQRDTMSSEQQVWAAMEELFVRLPKLLDERRLNSERPDSAFPTTVRLTARVVDRSVQKRRPFVTHSRQSNFDGKKLMETTDPEARSAFLRKAVAPLLNTLVLSNAKASDINVTRLHLAVTNFQDVETSVTSGVKSGDVSRLFASGAISSRSTERKRQQIDSVVTIDRKRKQDATKLDHAQSAVAGSRSRVTAAASNAVGTVDCPKGVDPTVLAELPPEIAAEVCRDYNHTAPIAKRPAKKANTIDRFFAPKSSK